MSTDFDAIVIGAGPGGEVVVSRLLTGGMRVALVERQLIGGECAYWACIPSKTLLRPVEARAEAGNVAGLATPALDWAGLRDYRDGMVRHLDDSTQVASYRQQGATVIKGAARLVGRDPWRVEVGGEQLAAGHVVVATGSRPVRPPVDGLDQVPVWTNREATTLRDVPPRVVMVGGGAVGVELGQFLARMGSQVTIVQRGPRLLGREEPGLGEVVAGHLRGDGVDVRTGRQVAAARRHGDDTVVELDDGGTIRTDAIVLGAGRRPRTAHLGLPEVGIALDPHGAPGIDEHCRVADRLWAVGDVTGRALFTHVAKYQARVAADTMLGKPRRADYTAIPRVVFAQPEIAAVGLTAAQAGERGMTTTATEVDLPATLARPWTYETRPTGTLGLLADADRRVLLGAWAVAPHAGEWIHQAALAIRAGIGIDVLRDAIPQFPTYTEGYLTAVEQLDV